MDDAVPPVADCRLAAFSEFLAERVGLYFPPNRWRELERAMRAAARDLGCRDAASCIQALMAEALTRSRIETLASHLTVGETYFFRERPSLDILERQILPELIASRRQACRKQLRLWSAGCCTGEEPYSIAILLSRLLPDIQDWNIAILGTDINAHFLRTARRGVYPEWSFRNPPPWLKRDYFTRAPDGRFEILPSIKSLVGFAYHNLAEDACPALWNNTNGMDVVFCRNVLMYFEPRQARRVVANLHRSLVDGGWLVVSPAEASAALLAPFQAVYFPEAVLYRKTGKGALAAVLPILPPAVWPIPAPSPEASLNSEPTISPERIQPPALSVSLLPPTGDGRDGGDQMDRRLYFDSPPPGPPPRGEGKKGPSPLQLNILAKQDASNAANAEPVSSSSTKAARLYEQGRYDEAEKILSCLLAAEQADAGALALLARIRANQGRLDEALEWCDKAVREDRLDPAAHYLRANILLEQGRLEEAAAGFRRVVYLDPHFPLAYFNLGNLLKRQGKSREAARHFANALELLGECDPHSIVPEAEGLTVGRLREVIRAGNECLA